ncbi:MAG: hydrogenase maturation nickel metallochaperone HypA [Sodalinema sp.]|uniref:hydrogenase maturation nickel metallochaperone HypA n=1 Tax=Sodalinema sp. TaxID=3080550 RepID=UPI00120967DA|nr:MAG: hydrogenase maturation nickel metallochaperone HypA [Phormidium sp. SL48-SHIP]
MHEVSIMAQTLEIALNEANRQGARQIHRLTVRVGSLSGVVPDALRFAFDVVAQDTIAEQAKFEIEPVAARCYCQACKQDFYPEDIIFVCPHCGTLSSQVLNGKELEVSSLEIS